MAWKRYVGKIEDYYPAGSHSVEPPYVTSANAKDRPGPVDNSDIIVNGVENTVEDLQLLRTLEEGRDYVLVPEEVWERLLKW